MKIEKPIFVVFEGIDGSGKSTLCKSLTEKLTERGIPSVNFTEPTNFETGKYLRKFLRGEIDLERKEQIDAFLNDREESLRQNILPSLESGKNVLLDRYMYSTAAYQSGDDLLPETIIEKNLKKNFKIPDLLFYLDLNPAIALERLSQRKENKERFETLAQLEKIRSAYNRILPKETIRIDGVKGPDEIVQECLEIFLRNFNRKFL
ncbi:dTMP kinase [Leptospira borgpetersenii serovar Hardjo-bovis]|uniref:Thymidylate kinase n=2 Tax=Leptospira borgpetersenii serovar Hardjo-bovis TaxID=338217 RepID=KTHY_LEPBL|nr:dTMP kinase [Leptospira borgpetersenii]Q04YY2.1 RecName: Full=Thymidylate kinase; AltName: Full=dTMP kinase [Leptospira borgpetersenii serovar Hardjo-bovis str. L550]ABJ79713.1 Thymidylate kinase [Leptospira borgpetersenii serovar Hardjo-bovis str. L550]AMX59102.1 thymidylate kinase [Leptospira borgpetersenii serovar Hardjo]AMX62331.1 thymidylate kinase [Leptospira borgpetersenii serovar Hardjo]AMX65573.1 thymidylate kinase [Leptospira borgpetersenii serovar Hardjo]AMX68807.1 thymidylate k